VPLEPEPLPQGLDSRHENPARLVTACLAFSLAVFPLGCAGDATAEAPQALSSPVMFPEIERLIGEQKFEAAAKQTASCSRSPTGGRPGDANPRPGEGHPTAHRAGRLRDRGRISQDRAVAGRLQEPRRSSLFYAHALRTYQQAYWWEISQRERWSATRWWISRNGRRQIGDAAVAAYAAAWAERESLGGLQADAWPEFIAANNFPRGVRGAVRDAVSYLFAELLADSSLWSPREENDVYRLDLEALLGDGAALAEAQAHPLARAAAVLADLEAWHRGKRQREAELEARLERARHLHAAFSQDADRGRIRADLERRCGVRRLRDRRWARHPRRLRRAETPQIAGAREPALASSVCAELARRARLPPRGRSAQSSARHGSTRRASVDQAGTKSLRGFFRLSSQPRRAAAAARYSLWPDGRERRILRRAPTCWHASQATRTTPRRLASAARIVWWWQPCAESFARRQPRLRRWWQAIGCRGERAARSRFRRPPAGWRGVEAAVTLYRHIDLPQQAAGNNAARPPRLS
jgi:hypothetical protein